MENLKRTVQLEGRTYADGRRAAREDITLLESRGLPSLSVGYEGEIAESFLRGYGREIVAYARQRQR